MIITILVYGIPFLQNYFNPSVKAAKGLDGWRKLNCQTDKAANF